MTDYTKIRCGSGVGPSGLNHSSVLCTNLMDLKYVTPPSSDRFVVRIAAVLNLHYSG